MEVEEKRGKPIKTERERRDNREDKEKRRRTKTKRRKRGWKKETEDKIHI